MELDGFRRHPDQKKWKPEITIHFLEEYSKHPCLYDPGHPDYKDARRRHEALRTMACDMLASWNMYMDHEAVKSKIRVLRNTYTNELKKRAERMLSEGHYKTNLCWFMTADRFLRNVVKGPGKVTENCNDLTREEEESSWNEDVVAEILHPIEESPEHPEGLIMELEDREPHGLTIPVTMESTRTSYCRPETRKRKKYSAWSEYDSGGPPGEVIAAVEEDEFDLFGRSVAIQMKKLPMIEALELQAEIQRVISAKRVAALRCRSVLEMESGGTTSSASDVIEIKVEDD